jgi:cobalamin biosynthesis protein CobW
MRGVPATVITGFLGAGKRASCGICWLAPRGIGPAIVVNKFAALGIDREQLLGCGDAACRRRSARDE